MKCKFLKFNFTVIWLIIFILLSACSTDKHKLDIKMYISEGYDKITKYDNISISFNSEEYKKILNEFKITVDNLSDYYKIEKLDDNFDNEKLIEFDFEGKTYEIIGELSREALRKRGNHNSGIMYRYLKVIDKDTEYIYKFGLETIQGKSIWDLERFIEASIESK